MCPLVRGGSAINRELVGQPGIASLPRLRRPPVCQVPGPGEGAREGDSYGTTGGAGYGEVT